MVGSRTWSTIKSYGGGRVGGPAAAALPLRDSLRATCAIGENFLDGRILGDQAHWINFRHGYPYS